MMQFVGRKHEFDLLNQCRKQPRARMVVLRGRRRIGKSRLLQEFGRYFDKTLVFSGLAPASSIDDKAQRFEFAQLLARQTGCVVDRYDDWSHLFWLLSQHIAAESTLVVFDEISWMASGRDAFLVKFKNAWDLYFSHQEHLVVALCGSLSLWIEENILSSTSYLGRIDLKLFIDELPLNQCQAFWGMRAYVAPYEMFKVLAVTGGVPKYLEMMNPNISAEENIRQLCFSTAGFLFDEFEHIFSDLFDKRHQTYQKIVTALVDGSKQQKEIADALNQVKGGTLTQYLADLEKAGFISQDFSWCFREGRLLKTRQYRLRDNYSRFYLKYIRPNQEKIRSGNPLGQLSLLPQWSVIMGLQFENLIVTNRHLLKQALGVQPNDIVLDGPYLQRSNSKQQGCQIDYLIQTRFNSLYLCEIKFSKYRLDSHIIDEVKEKVARLKLPRGFSIMPVLIHVNGVSEALEEANFFTHILDFSQLLKVV